MQRLSHSDHDHTRPQKRWEAYLYTAWTDIIQRCYNPNNKKFKGWGGRGITMYEPWRNNFAAFALYVLNTLGGRPEGHSLDRIDNDGGYRPGNIHWATSSEQQHNTRTNRWLTFNGQRMILEDFARLLGMSHSVIQRRLDKGELPEQIAAQTVYKLVA